MDAVLLAMVLAVAFFGCGVFGCKIFGCSIIGCGIIAAAFLAVVGLLMFSFVTLLGVEVADLPVLGFSSVVAMFPLLCCCHH